MAELVSPGVSITVEDQSFYASAGAGTVPLIVIATAQDKVGPDGASIAGFTTSALAGQVRLITSQRDLITNYGNPLFQSTGGTALHGHELNEYGLLAAYSFLGAANRAYVLRADLDLAELEASATAPEAAPIAGSYWLDTANTVWGLKMWDGSAWVKQTVKVPTVAQISTEDKPKNSYGLDGEFAVVYWDDEGNTLSEIKLYEKIGGVWANIGDTSNWLAGVRTFQIGSYLTLPTGVNVGDMLLQLDSPNLGTKLSTKVYYDGQFISQDNKGFDLSSEAFSYYDGNGGVSIGDLWIDFDSATASVTVKRHNGVDSNVAQGSTEVADNSIALAAHNGAISLQIILNDSEATLGAAGVIDVSLFGFDGDSDGNASADDVVEAINSAISAAITSGFTLASDLSATNENGKVTLTSAAGYDILVRGVAAVDGGVAGFDASDLGFVDSVVYSNWEVLSFESKATEITGDLADGTLWYDSLVSNNNIDILMNDTGSWVSYPYDVNIAASEPTTQKDGTALVAGDLWIDSGDLENYPQINRWNGLGWTALDETDQETANGVIFADFRSSTTGGLDADAPNPAIYPYNMIAWNKRLSGGNVKSWDAAQGIWVDASGNREDGSPRMLRKAQRSVVVKALQEAVISNTDIRNESNRFNLIATPGYPELMDDMLSLNIDRKETAFVVGDTPMRLSPSASAIQAWANNENNAVENGEDGLLVSGPYVGVHYPHGLATNLDGSNVMVPASHIVLRTLAYNDQVAFPWFAPAGFQRGLVNNATSVGYLDADSNEYVPVSLSEGQRDTLYINRINPIGNFPGRGLAVFGQKTLNPVASALDRINVARLTVYIRERLDDIVKPFLFEPNDEITRQNAKVTVDRFLGNLVSQRGLYDFVTVCDTSNNTPERIDRNELHIDIAIQPVKAVEFIYIPIRIQNTAG